MAVSIGHGSHRWSPMGGPKGWTNRYHVLLYPHRVQSGGASRVLNTWHRRTRPYRPQTNGKAERFIQTLSENGPEPGKQILFLAGGLAIQAVTL
jgi:hypothetical protein